MTRLILFNKPFNVLCQFTDRGTEGSPRPTLSDYIDVPNVYPAGRLDRDSEGLVVLTNDGKLQHRLTDPRNKTEKVYWAQVEGDPLDSDLEPIRRGLTLKDGPCRPAHIRRIAAPQALWPRDPPIRVRKSIPDCWIELTLTEGRNRQVRRMTAAIGFPTLRLIRAQIGDWTLGDLAPGTWREA